MIRLKVFISSVQKELEEERQAVGGLLATDPFLSACTVPRLFDKYPAPLLPNKQAYLDLLRTCHIYLLIIGRDYGELQEGKLSATRQEYSLAQQLKMPTLICVKGGRNFPREELVEAFMRQVSQDGHTYSRFTSMDELREAVKSRLIEYLRNQYESEPTPRQIDIARGTLRSATDFERQPVLALTWGDLDAGLAREIVAAAEEKSAERLSEAQIIQALYSRAYLWLDPGTSLFHPMAAGVLLFAKVPSRAFLQARLQLDAYVSSTPDASPLDSVHIDAPLSQAVEQAVAFVRRNTERPLKVEGLHRRKSEALPQEALREAIVNAVAHRDYAVAGARVTIEVFADHVTVRSPGHPAGGQSIQRIQQGLASSRSRNPLIVQGLTWLELMDDRGTGIRRMREAMDRQGLELPTFTLLEDEFVVTLSTQPRLDAPVSEDQIKQAPQKTPIIEGLPHFQQTIIETAAQYGYVTTALCVQKLGISRDTAWRHLQELSSRGCLEQTGSGRGTRYKLVSSPAAPPAEAEIRLESGETTPAPGANQTQIRRKSGDSGADQTQIRLKTARKSGRHGKPNRKKPPP
jgi:predicted HTH transcriptional regulator